MSETDNKKIDGGQTSDESFINDMMTEVPEVQPHVIAREKKRKEELTGIKDSGGESFDPTIHMSKDGKPSVTKTGKFRKKKATEKLNDPQEKAKEKENNDNIVAASAASAELVQSLKRNIYGTFFDFQYGDDRHKVHTDLTTAYFVDSGGIKLTPLQTLCVMEGFMAVEIFNTDKGKKKLGGLKTWVVSKYLKFRGKNGSYVNSRTNDVGKNDAGEKDNSEE